MTCPPNCAVRNALKYLSPDRQISVSKAILDGSLTRKEVCDIFKREAGTVVYRGSITRHKSHAQPEIEPFTPEIPRPERASVHAFVKQEYDSLSALQPSSLSDLEVKEALEASEKAYKAWRESVSDDDGMDMGYFYSDNHLALWNLASSFSPEAFNRGLIEKPRRPLIIKGPPRRERDGRLTFT